PRRANAAAQRSLATQLLPQPHSFEGLVVVAVVLEMGDEPVPEGSHGRDGHLHLKAAELSGKAEGADGQHPVFKIANVGPANMPSLVIVLSYVCEPPAYTFTPHIGSLQGGLVRLEPGLGVVEPDVAIPITSVERLGGLQHPLHVLLRHR